MAPLTERITLERLDPAIRLFTVFGVLAGTLIIVFGEPGQQGIVGVILIIVALVSLTVVVRNGLSTSSN